MQKPKSIKELFRNGGKRLHNLEATTRARAGVRDQVLAALPPKLAAAVVSAGMDSGRLTIGVSSAVWASRLRYVTERLRQEVGGALGTEIQSVRIKVIPPRP